MRDMRRLPFQPHLTHTHIHKKHTYKKHTHTRNTYTQIPHGKQIQGSRLSSIQISIVRTEIIAMFEGPTQYHWNFLVWKELLVETWLCFLGEILCSNLYDSTSIVFSPTFQRHHRSFCWNYDFQGYAASLCSILEWMWGRKDYSPTFKVIFWLRFLVFLAA